MKAGGQDIMLDTHKNIASARARRGLHHNEARAG